MYRKEASEDLTNKYYLLKKTHLSDIFNDSLKGREQSIN